MSLTDKVFNQVRACQLNRFKVERNGDTHIIYVQLSEIEKLELFLPIDGRFAPVRVSVKEFEFQPREEKRTWWSWFFN